MSVVIIIFSICLLGMLLAPFGTRFQERQDLNNQQQQLDNDDCNRLINLNLPQKK